MKTIRWFIPRAAWSYLAVALAAFLMFVPRCNSGYLGHAGPGYLLLPLGFLIAVFCLSLTIWRSGAGSRIQVAQWAGVSLLIFAVLSLGVAFLGAHAMNACFAQYVNHEVKREEWLFIWGLLFPFVLPLVS